MIIAACSTASGRSKIGHGICVSMFPLIAVIYFGLSAPAGAELTQNASEALSVLEEGLRTDGSVENLNAAGQRAEELLLGGRNAVMPVAASPGKGNNFLARLLPGKKGPITVKEPISYRNSILNSAASPKMMMAGVPLAFGFMAAQSLLFPSFLPEKFDSLPYVALAITLLLLPNFIFGIVGGYFAGFIDRWRR